MDRPAYADYPAPQKFQAIQAIIMQRLREHPKAMCSYSGGSDSDILIHLIEQCRQMLPSLPPVHYVFFNTGLEMEATKRHVKETAERFGVEIETVKPKVGIVNAVRKYGIPFASKVFSQRLEDWQKNSIPLDIVEEFNEAEDKLAKYEEFDKRYPNSKQTLEFLLSYRRLTDEFQYGSQFSISSAAFFLDFLKENQPPFRISKRCCEYCKKRPAHAAMKGYEMTITGERKAEGGQRAALTVNGTGCFSETTDGKFRLRPLYWVTDKDKEWYKNAWAIRYSDAYEVYGFKRTGCCGCPINARVTKELERLRPYEPNLVKAAWAVFGDSYRYRQKYNEYKAERYRQEKLRKIGFEQIGIDEVMEWADGS